MDSTGCLYRYLNFSDRGLDGLLSCCLHSSLELLASNEVRGRLLGPLGGSFVYSREDRLVDALLDNTLGIRIRFTILQFGYPSRWRGS